MESDKCEITGSSGKSAQKFPTYYIAADGGCKKNGNKNSRATWAYCVISEDKLSEKTHPIYSAGAKKDSELIKDITTSECAGVLSAGSTNNQGELNAILRGLNEYIQLGVTGNVIILTDSKYSIECIRSWYPKWVREKITHKKKNIPLISEIFNTIIALRKQGNIVEFQHVGGHGSAPGEFGDQWKKWYLNYRVDYFCNHPQECAKFVDSDAQ